MKPIRLIALALLVAGALLVLLAFTTGERVIVGALENGQPIIGRPTNTTFLAAGGIGIAASVIAFAAGFLTGSRPPATQPASSSPANTHPEEDATPR